MRPQGARVDCDSANTNGEIREASKYYWLSDLTKRGGKKGCSPREPHIQRIGLLQIAQIRHTKGVQAAVYAAPVLLLKENEWLLVRCFRFRFRQSTDEPQNPQRG